MKEIIVAILLLAGALFILVAAIGLFRFRDTFSRMHATTKATSFGILLITCGVAILFFSWIMMIKALLLVVFIYLTAPLAAHSISKSIEKDNSPGG